MTVPTDQTGTWAIPQQGSHHWIMTVDVPGRAALTHTGTLTPPDGWTRSDAFTAIRHEVIRKAPETASAGVVFFAFESNRL